MLLKKTTKIVNYIKFYIKNKSMESGIVTVFASLATISVIFAIVLGLGKKYHDEDQQNIE